MLGIALSIANDFQVNDKLIGVTPNHKIEFIDLCKFSNEDGTLSIFVHPFNSLFLNHNNSNMLYSNPFNKLFQVHPFVFNVVECHQGNVFCPPCHLGVEKIEL